MLLQASQFVTDPKTEQKRQSPNFATFSAPILNIFSHFLSARSVRYDEATGRKASRKERSETFSSILQCCLNFFPLLSLLWSEFFSDLRLRYIKQAPLVIINVRMSYCEFNFSFPLRPLPKRRKSCETNDFLKFFVVVVGVVGVK